MTLLALIALWAQEPSTNVTPEEREAREALEAAASRLAQAASIRFDATLTVKKAADAPDEIGSVSMAARARTHVKLKIVSSLFDEKVTRTIILVPGRHFQHDDFLAEYADIEIKSKPTDRSYLEPLGNFYMGRAVAQMLPSPNEPASVKWSIERPEKGLVRVTLEILRLGAGGGLTERNAFDLDEATHDIRACTVTALRGGATVSSLGVRYANLEIGRDIPDAEFAIAPPKGAKQVTDFGDPVIKKLMSYTGKPFPDLALETVDGKPAALKDDLNGKVALVVFWGRFFANCQEQSRQWAKLRDEFKPEDLALVAVSWDAAAILRDFQSSDDIKYDLRRAPKNADQLPLPAAAIKNLPTIFVVDRKGTIRFIHDQRQNLTTYEEEIKALMQGP